ncbi:MAG: aminoglycoside phosphotransferase family protein [Lachnospiraceae bacterium]|nr:aminoglycoside phosphotransferase family protein [Lachnospiraceae bacterium]
MKKVLVIYDDSRKPGQEICMVTGGKSYGSTIFRRQSLKDRAKERFISYGSAFMSADEFKQRSGDMSLSDICVFRVYSDHEISDMKKVSVLLEKSLYAKENYAVINGDRVAAVIYPSAADYMDDEDGLKAGTYERIETDAFTDISDPAGFMSFITSGFDARFFNALEGDEYTVVKRSDSIEKLKKEYEYFNLLPPAMKQWYAVAYDYREEDGHALYSMERYHMTDLAIRYVHGAIGEEEFRAIMDRLFHFISSRSERPVSDEEYDREARALYIDKVDQRIAMLKEQPAYERIAALIASGTAYKDIDEIVGRYKKLYESITSGRKFIKVAVVGHGDLCFSNILYNHDARLLKLIDPKGADSEDEMYMNPYYDIAKLSHSVCGAYDFFNSDLYEIVLNDSMKFELKIDCDNDKYVRIFNEYLEKNGIDARLLRLYEASLFLSMLPLHIDREKKVFGFLLNAIGIMDSLD